MQQKNSEQLATALFGPNYSLALIRAHDILTAPSRNDQNREDEARMRTGRILIDEYIVKSISDHRVFPSILAAVIGAYGTVAPVVLEEIIYCHHEKNPATIPLQPLPTILGVFKGLQIVEAQRLDDLTNLVSIKVCSVLKKFVFGQYHFAAADENALKEQMGLLSEAVTQFVRASDPRGVGARKAHALALLSEIREEWSAGSPISQFGSILVNELAFKLFGTLSVGGRTDALALLHKYLTTPSVAKTAYTVT